MGELSDEARGTKSPPSLRGLKKVLLPLSRPESLDRAGASSLAAFGPLSSGEGKQSRDLVGFLGQVALFEEFSRADLVRLARVTHERHYGDGECIYEQDRPGTALFIVRSGVVEISRKGLHGEQVLVITLEPPASFSEQAAMGAEVVRWTSALARGAVCLLALGSSDLDALGRRFPHVANKVLRKLAQITALRLQALVDAQLSQEEEPASGEHPE
jgi:signal-transduction protein with cAMP-binding, CBS, and nucleotidyltransferase domain